MAITRVHKNSKYTVMSNHHLNNPKLSLKAKGLLSFMLSKPDYWDFSVAGLKSQLKEGRDSIAAAIQELIDNSYISREQNQDAGGKFNGTTYHVYEEPISDLPITENPISVNQPQVNTKGSKDYKEVNTKKSIKKAEEPEVYSFDEFWNDYDKKQGTAECKKKYSKLTPADKAKMKLHVVAYVASTPDKQYRKNPSTYLNQKLWLDELPTSTPGTGRINYNDYL